MTKSITKVVTAGALIISGVALTTSIAFAQTPQMNLAINDSGTVRLVGTVSAISNSTLSVTSWLGTWTVNTSNTTAFRPDNTTTANIHTGDTVAVSGTLGTGMTITATNVNDLTLKSAQNNNSNNNGNHWGWLKAWFKIGNHKNK